MSSTTPFSSMNTDSSAASFFEVPPARTRVCLRKRNTVDASPVLELRGERQRATEAIRGAQWRLKRSEEFEEEVDGKQQERIDSVAIFGARRST